MSFENYPVRFHPSMCMFRQRALLHLYCVARFVARAQQRDLIEGFIAGNWIKGALSAFSPCTYPADRAPRKFYGQYPHFTVYVGIATPKMSKGGAL